MALPAGQAAYLYFQQWRVLDYFDSSFFDGGDCRDQRLAAAAGTWVNGPAETMSAPEPDHGSDGFGGDSRGYLASRLDLSAFAGADVTPRFTMHTDSSVSFLGWASTTSRSTRATRPEATRSRSPRPRRPW